MSRPASGGWEGKGAVLGCSIVLFVHTQAQDTGQRLPENTCFLPVPSRVFTGSCSSCPAGFSSPSAHKPWCSLDVKHSLQFFLGLWLMCGCLWERVQGKLSVRSVHRLFWDTAQARPHHWHHHTQAQCAEMSSPGKAQTASGALSDHSLMHQLSPGALNPWPPLAKSFQDGKGTKIHICDLVWELLNIKNDHRTI